jgi:hypothetical protein
MLSNTHPTGPLYRFSFRLLLAALSALAAVLTYLAFTTASLFAAGTTPAYLGSPIKDSVRAASSYVDVRVLSAGVAKSVTVPTFAADAKALVVVVFSANCSDYYVNVTGTAVEPTIDITDGSGSERNPSALQFYQGDTYSVLAPTACKVTLAMYLKRIL